jgi:hypothetical protein
MSLPSYVRYSEEMWSSNNPGVVFRAAQEYLDILYNEFMIRRMMVARLDEDHNELLHLAHRILKTVLEASSVRGARGANVGCVPWIVSIDTSAVSLFYSLLILSSQRGNQQDKMVSIADFSPSRSYSMVYRQQGC